LIDEVFQVSDRPKRTLANWLSAGRLRHSQDAPLNLRRKAKQPHNLGDSNPADTLPPGDVGLVLGFAGSQERLPFKGLPEELD